MPIPHDAVLLRVGDDFQTVVNRHPAGSTFRIAAGLHRMQQVRPRNGDTFIGEPGATLSGAKVLTGFVRDGSTWRVGGQTQQGFRFGSMLPGWEREAHPEDLFIDGRRLRHVPTRAQVGPGHWFFDYDGDTIYIGEDPTGRTVETSVTTFAFDGEATRAADVTIANLTIRHYANYANRGAINARLTPGWTIRYVDTSHNHGGGISIGTGTRVEHSRMSHNGQIGITGNAPNDTNPSSRRSIIRHNEISHNRELGFDWGWEGGGTKFKYQRNMLVEHNWIHSNHGAGLWFDIDNIDSEIRSNLIENNDAIGLFYEISYAARIYWNTIRNNGRNTSGDGDSGMYISNSRDVEVFGNAISGQRIGIRAENRNRGVGAHGTWEVTGLHVHSNDIAQTMWSGLKIVHGGSEYFTSRGNRFDGNTYRMVEPEGWFHWDRAFMSFAQWRAAGQDANGRVISPGMPVLPAGALAFQPAHHGPVPAP